MANHHPHPVSRTILDEVGHTFLEGIRSHEVLELYIAESVSSEPDEAEGSSLKIPDPLKGLRTLSVNEESRGFKVIFGNVVAYPVIDESYTSWDDYEEKDSKDAVQIIHKSKWLDHMNEKHGWYNDVPTEPAIMYRIWTLSEVVEVIARKPPIVEDWDGAE